MTSDQPFPPSQPTSASRPARAVLAVALLAAGVVTWAALPMSGSSAGARPALVAAVCFAVLSAAQLADRVYADRPGTAPRREAAYVPAAVQLWRRARDAARITPWPQCLTVAVLAVEALHPSRPWHTAVLGVVLLGYLLAVHLTETSARPAVLRPQLPLIAAGLGLLALSVGAAALPSTGLGTTAIWLAALAAIAALVTAALTLPI